MEAWAWMLGIGGIFLAAVLAKLFLFSGETVGEVRGTLYDLDPANRIRLVVKREAPSGFGDPVVHVSSHVTLSVQMVPLEPHVARRFADLLDQAAS